MSASDSWQNAKKFSILGMPIILDEPLVRNSRDIPAENKRVILALEENILLDKSSLSVKEIDSVNVNTKIIKLDRFENWIRVDGELEFDIEYLPKEPGLLEEDLNIDKFLDRLNLDKEEVDDVKLDWERFFDNEDLEDDDEILDEFDDDFDDIEDENEEEDYRNDKNSTEKVNIKKEKTFSVIVDLGDTNINDQDIVGLSRVEFNKAKIIGNKDIKIDLVLGIEINNNKRAINDEEKWLETHLLTQGDYSLAKSGIRIEEIVAYQLEPEIRDIRIIDGELNLNGFLNIQIAFYHEDQERSLSVLNLRKPISINNIVDGINFDLNIHKIYIKNSHIHIKDSEILVYEAEAVLWLQEIDIESLESKKDEVNLESSNLINESVNKMILQDDETSFDDLLEEHESMEITGDIPEEPIMEEITEDTSEFAEVGEINPENNKTDDYILCKQEFGEDEPLEEELKDLIPELSDLDIEFIDDSDNDNEALEEIPEEILEPLNDLKDDDIDKLENSDLMTIEEDADTLYQSDPIMIDVNPDIIEQSETVSGDFDESNLEQNESISFKVEENIVEESHPAAIDSDISSIKGVESESEYSKDNLESIESTNSIDEAEESSSKGLSIKINTEELSYIPSYKSHLKSEIKKISKKKVDLAAQVSSKQFTLSLYLIKQGDTLESIANRFSIDPEEILTYNKITVKDIYPNNSIFIRKNS